MNTVANIMHDESTTITNACPVVGCVSPYDGTESHQNSDPALNIHFAVEYEGPGIKISTALDTSTRPFWGAYVEIEAINRDRTATEVIAIGEAIVKGGKRIAALNAALVEPHVIGEAQSQVDILWAAAQKTPCKYAECTGDGHEYILPESDWSHEAVNASFDGGIVLGSISDRLGTFTGDINFEGNGEMTAAEFRDAADTYEAFPAWLRSMADRMDELSAQAWIEAHPSNWDDFPVAELMRTVPLGTIRAIFAQMKTTAS